MHRQFCRLLTIVALFQCLFSLSLLSHGFEESTRVKTWKGEKTIQTIADRVSKNKKIVSYHHRKQRWTSGYVRSAGKSETNCYIKICLEKDHVPGQDCGGEMLCTPAQEFYVPTKNSWLPAAQLQLGDRLFCASGEQKAISHIEFVKQPLTVYILEVAKHHNFFVGKSSVLTHNTALPWECSIIFSIPFGAGGGATFGGEAGSFFGPVGIVGGAIIGGFIGWFGSKLLNQNKVHNYEAYFDIDVIEGYFKADKAPKETTEKIITGMVSPEPPEDPEDQKKIICSRKGAFREAKRDAKIENGQQPEKIEKIPMRSADHEGRHVLQDSSGKVINTREYHYTNRDGQKVIIQDHSAGHPKGGQGPHFNVRPADKPRTGKIKGTKDHYSFQK